MHKCVYGNLLLLHNLQFVCRVVFTLVKQNKKKYIRIWVIFLCLFISDNIRSYKVKERKSLRMDYVLSKFFLTNIVVCESWRFSWYLYFIKVLINRNIKVNIYFSTNKQYYYFYNNIINLTPPLATLATRYLFCKQQNKTIYCIP